MRLGAALGIGLASIAYVIAFVLLHARIGDAIVALSTVPLIAAAWQTGLRGGIIAGLVCVVVNVSLMQTLGGHDGFRPQQLPRIFAAIAIGTAAGWARDVTRRLRAAVKEREALLKEIHHRVKNNLQVISSLIRLQARQSELPAVRLALEESERRIQAIALVHERLYETRDLSAIAVDDYLRTLVADVLAVHGKPGVTATTDVAAGSLPLQTAIPCGLIVNELVTNALKHAFPDARGGTIRVAMTAREREIELVVADDGVGLPAGFDPRATTTLGLELVYAFAQQLDATVDVASTGGTTFTLRFAAG